MANTTSKKTGRKKTGKRVGRYFGLFCLFLFVAATLIAGFYFMALYQSEPQESQGPRMSGQGKNKPLPQKIELPPAPLKKKPAQPHQESRSKTPDDNARPGKPLVAIVIDDMGYRLDTGRALIAMDLPLSFSFLPFTPFSEALQKEALARGRDILLHLPLEPMNPKAQPGPGVLTTAMDPETIKGVFRDDRRAVPKAIGINNHMGSRFTADPKAMRVLLSLVRASNLFFLDSATSSQSVAYDLSREMGITSLRRDVFLDNEQENILAQLERLVRLAEKHGQAVGIGHAHPAMLEALRRYQDQLRSRVELVGINRLAK